MYSMVVGFGSIGKQHYESLKKIVGKENLFIFSRRELNIDNCISNLDQVNLNEFNYFVIANEATLHAEWIEKLKDTNSKILVEKPLCTEKIKTKEIKKLELTEIEKVEFVNHSWLPDWRENRDYRESVSSRKELGGGVLYELSHDFDLAKYIFGDYKFIDFNLSKYKKLNLDVYDTFIGNAKNVANGLNLFFSLSMASKESERYINIQTKNNSYRVDFIDNSLRSEEGFTKLDNDQASKKYLLQRQHEIILNNDENFLSGFNEGQWIVNLINEIEERNE